MATIDRTYPFHQIHMTWRQRSGDRRIVVGKLMRHGDGFTFSYSQEGLALAKTYGFTEYMGLPSNTDIDQTLAQELFYRRLTNTERNDAKRIYEFFCVDLDRLDDKLYLLAFTAGKSSIDNIEFLPLLEQTNEAYIYVTDIAGIHYYVAEGAELGISVGDTLIWESDRNNCYDDLAVVVKTRQGKTLGYIKQGINKVFSQTDKVELRVHNIVTVDKTKQVFIQIHVPAKN